MPIIAIAIGVIGTAAGTAIGAAIGGTILGISAATIGGVIGAGIAGGIWASANGGSFGRGFAMGAAGAALGGFLKAGFGDAAGAATQAADGTTTASMMASQGGADFAVDALSGTGDLAATGAVAGMGEMGGTMGGAETFALDSMGSAPTGTAIDGTTGAAAAPAWEGGLQETANNASMGFDPSTAGNMSPTTGNMAAPTAATGFNTDTASLSNQFSAPPTTTPEVAAPTGDYGGTAAPTTPGTSLENIGSATESAPAAPTDTIASGTSEGGGFGQGVKKMFNTSDAWLKDTLGKNAPSTGKLVMGGGQYLMDQYNLSKQARQAKGLAPMSFEEFSQNYTDPGAYRNASENLARGGRTGSLPVLLARMKNDARGKYASYLPGAKEKYYDVQSGVQANRNASLARLFNGMGYGT